MHHETERRPVWRGRSAALALAATVALAGCDSLLDVENPNNLTDEQAQDPIASGSLANGALATVARGLGYYIVPEAAASDELEWVGSRDSWGDLNKGFVSNAQNEFTDFAFEFIAEGRWLADEAVRLLEGHDAEGALLDRTNLARSYLYAAVSYTYIADWLENFPFSDRDESAAPVGADNMDTVYDQAIAYLDAGLAIAQSEGDDELATFILAQRARTKHARAVWALLNPPGSTPADPLVNASGAEDDALAVLADIGTTADTRWTFSYGPQTIWSDLGWQVNSRLELRFGDAYIVPTEDNKRRESTALMDPIDAVPAPGADAIMDRFEAGGQYPDLTVTSAREMHLIAAEVALADNRPLDFQTHINHVRDMDDLTDWTPLSTVTAEDMLLHMRMSNLYLTGRRLNDMYRFGELSANWESTSTAVTEPGTIFPISQGEKTSNLYCVENPGAC